MALIPPPALAIQETYRATEVSVNPQGTREIYNANRIKSVPIAGDSSDLIHGEIISYNGVTKTWQFTPTNFGSMGWKYYITNPLTLTGGGTPAAPVMTSIIFDTPYGHNYNSDYTSYDTGTGVFTAPKTGRYLFGLTISPATTDNTNPTNGYQIQVTTSNDTFHYRSHAESHGDATHPLFETKSFKNYMYFFEGDTVSIEFYNYDAKDLVISGLGQTMLDILYLGF